MEVEYYRLWAGNSGDSGTWDTDFIDIPDDTPDDQIEEAVRRAASKLPWDEDIPVIVGVYNVSEDEEEMDP